MANSNATKVAPFANGDRISVGTNPLVNALIPSAAHTDRTQCSVELYFWPVERVKPSVCIRDLITSIG